MAGDSEEVKPDGEIENPKPDDAPAPEPAPAPAPEPATSLAASFPRFSVNIWPPTQRTRDAVINRLIENLSTPSILSKRYGTLQPDEASSIARLIEQEAFAVASASASASPPSVPAGDEVGSAEASMDEGIEILQIYSKEISRRMIESVKARGSSGSLAPPEGNAAPAAGDSGDVADSVPEPTVPASEEIASGESQPLVA